MPVCRLIFRLDFNLNYEIVDHPGELMRLIDKESKSYLSTIKESQDRHGIAGQYQSDDGKEMLEFTVEPKSIVATFELAEGIALKNFTENENFSLLSRLTDYVIEKYNINDIARSGIRLFYFGNEQNENDKVASYRSFFNTSLINGFEEHLGKIQDYAINFDGATNDGISYRCRSGPLMKDEEYKKHFQYIGDTVNGTSNWDFMIDIDLYEKNIAISKISMNKWFGPQIEKATNLIKFIESEVNKGKGN